MNIELLISKLPIDSTLSSAAIELNMIPGSLSFQLKLDRLIQPIELLLRHGKLLLLNAIELANHSKDVQEEFLYDALNMSPTEFIPKIKGIKLIPMKAIWKFNLTFDTSFQLIEMPIDAEIISFRNQNEHPVIWAIVNTKNDKERRPIFLIETGKIVPEEVDRFIGTASFLEDCYILHCFEGKRN